MIDWILVIFSGILGGVLAPYVLNIFTYKRNTTLKRTYPNTVTQKKIRVILLIFYILSILLILFIVLFIAGFINFQLPPNFILSGKSLIIIAAVGLILGIWHILIQKIYFNNREN